MFTTACKKEEEMKDYTTIDDDIITKYLSANNITTAQKQASGLYFLPVRTNANAPKVAVGSSVAVLFTGHLLDAAGTVFDASSQHSNLPVDFVVGARQVIPGFEEGVSLMHVGDKAELLIPSQLAYGATGSRNGAVAPNSVVRFEVEVLDFNAIDEGLIQKYLTDKSITTAQKLATGVYFLPVTTNAAGVRATAGATVSVLYTGHLLDATGTVFDASSQHGNTPLKFVLGNKQVIPGFEAGVALMHKGDKAEIIIPSTQAYAERSIPPTVPAHAVLRFEVELVDVQ
ncbi:FKBP-type peptidyl-prolyl cis-trans isomerase [Hymenobacter sp. DH14]|uniref:Peptidyl-prolyl cis-trans isomerase n=1 Tax=Hymenobacter cyanobacteriorum TaxID=2926463 RepID=A0A9X1VGB6_9BACT|nr:FKBP-type peptidyl-prolyl cis-trans isomerase [Hymenobacter cyanobacteriorum]MCI1187608.1 FKBP-type peptidyl-prolyl cis-trans isomerase [Hymenobacter cyanobacteriorum]